MTTVPTPQAPQTPLRLGGLTLRPTTVADCGFVVDVEEHPDNAPHVEHWSRAQHEASLDRPGTVHRIIETRGARVGFVLLEDADDPNDSLLLRRIAVITKGRGHGRTAVLLTARYCFDLLGFHRLWLNVAAENRRAYVLYQRLGFVEEGVARESVKKDGKYVSMRVMSLLDREYREHPALGGTEPE